MKQFDYAKVKDPEYFRDGRLDAHSDHVYYASEEEVWDKETSYRESLNGLWKFQYARNYESAIPGFEAEDYNCKDWEEYTRMKISLLRGTLQKRQDLRTGILI